MAKKTICTLHLFKAIEAGLLTFSTQNNEEMMLELFRFLEVGFTLYVTNPKELIPHNII